MDDREKLPIVIKHWIGHNGEHVEEYRQWAEKAGKMGLERVKARITAAMEAITQANNRLTEALEELEAC
jgi:hypothetical protein